MLRKADPSSMYRSHRLNYGTWPNGSPRTVARFMRQHHDGEITHIHSFISHGELTAIWPQLTDRLTNLIKSCQTISWDADHGRQAIVGLVRSPSFSSSLVQETTYETSAYDEDTGPWLIRKEDQPADDPKVTIAGVSCPVAEFLAV